jgi:hypothetical protein
MQTGATKGVDLEVKYGDVERILFSKFRGKVALLTATTDLQREDILQEVYKGLLVRNDGKCPFDPGVAKLGTYVHMVCRCILSNLITKHVTRSNRELLVDETELTGQAAPEWSRPALSAGSVLSRFDDYLSSRGDSEDLELARRAAPLMFQGYKKRELIRALSCKGKKVDEMVEYLQKAVRDWAALGETMVEEETQEVIERPDYLGDIGWFLEAIYQC